MFVLESVYAVVLFYLGLSVLFLAVFAVAGRLGGTDDVSPTVTPTTYRKIGVLIPAYKEDAVIIESVRTNLRQKYPADRFELIVIADSIHPSVLAQLAELPIRVIPVSFETSTVSKAINAALAQIPAGQYDVLMVADADNHMATDFLSRINLAFEQGWQAVQGHRVAKNTNTSVAVLDAISEEINNHLFRQGSRALGLASSIIGSGMAFEPEVMRSGMASLHTMGGYDKELEMNITLTGRSIAYLADAYIYDEKVASKAVFENQRTRWIAAQWQFLTHYFRPGLRELAAGRMTSGFKMLQAMVLPRVLLLGVLTLLSALSLLATQPVFQFAAPTLLLLLSLSLVISVPNYLWKRLTVRELLVLPVLMLRFARAMLNMRKAFRRFMHTPHTGTPDVQLQPNKSV
jgi:cellulose synthase/poly-beta-1,6-N-acetylglucosamine synthase-like glycosyltransferase